MLKLALVVPCYNEQEALPHTLPLLVNLLNNLQAEALVSADSYLVLVDDGSQDLTWRLIHSACEQYPKQVTGLKLAGNVGHQNALYAGLVAQIDRCDAAISLDADLQDDVAVIRNMVVAYLEQHADLVYGVRKARNKDSWFKRSTARCYYKILRWLGADIIEDHADFRLMSAKALRILREYQEVQLFLRGIVRLFGMKEAVVQFDRDERLHGQSKYTLKKMLSLAFTGITSLSIRPLRVIMLLGITCTTIALLVFAWAVSSWLQGVSVSGWTSIICVQLFFFGIILFCLGVIAEYIGRVYIETKRRPRYMIEQSIH